MHNDDKKRNSVFKFLWQSVDEPQQDWLKNIHMNNTLVNETHMHTDMIRPDMIGPDMIGLAVKPLAIKDHDSPNSGHRCKGKPCKVPSPSQKRVREIFCVASFLLLFEKKNCD